MPLHRDSAEAITRGPDAARQAWRNSLSASWRSKILRKIRKMMPAEIAKYEQEPEPLLER